MKKANQATIEIISQILILLFLYTSVMKLSSPTQFLMAMRQVSILKPFSEILTIAIPTIEILLCILLISKKRKLGLFLSTVLLTIFTIYVSYMLIFIPKLPCSCGGIIQHMTWHQHLYFNISMTFLSALAFYLIRSNSNQYRITNSF